MRRAPIAREEMGLSLDKVRQARLRFKQSMLFRRVSDEKLLDYESFLH